MDRTELTKSPFIDLSKVKSLSLVRLFATPWTVAYQAPLSMGFSRQEYWSGLPFPSPEDLPDPGIKPQPPALQTDTLLSEPPGKPINRSNNTTLSHLSEKPSPGLGTCLPGASTGKGQISVTKCLPNHGPN